MTLDEDFPPRRATVKALLQSAVSVARPKGLFYTLLTQPVPAAWARDRHLRYARHAIFEGGVARVGEYILTLSPQTGLSIDKEAAA